MGESPDDDEETRLQKTILLVTSLAVTVSAIGWGLMYLAFDERLAASIPLSYFVISLPSILVIRSMMGTKKTLVFVFLVVAMATGTGYFFGTFWG